MEHGVRLRFYQCSDFFTDTIHKDFQSADADSDERLVAKW